MVNILKIVRYAVKTIAVLISLCFVFNSVNGILSAVNLANGNIQPVIDPGDFKIKYDDLYIEAGVNITNDGIYTIEGIVIGMIFQMKTNVSENWVTILNQTSVTLGIAPPGGITILPRDTQLIGIVANLTDFDLTPSEIATLFELGPSWDLMDLINIEFDAQLILDFSISFAFRQYILDVEILLNNEAVANGLGV